MYTYMYGRDTGEQNVTINLLFLGWFLSEDPEEEVSLLTRLEGTRNNDVTAWVQIKPILNLTSVSEAAGGPST